jgi:hypothetical protein
LTAPFDTPGNEAKTPRTVVTPDADESAAINKDNAASSVAETLGSMGSGWGAVTSPPLQFLGVSIEPDRCRQD